MVSWLVRIYQEVFASPRTRLEEVKIHMFGTIQISTRKATPVRKYLDKHRREFDGILVWYALVESQDNDGNKEVRISKLMKTTRKPFNRHYTGGLLRYINDIDSAYSELESLDFTIRDDQKIIVLLGNMEEGLQGIGDYIIHHCRENFTQFQQCVDYIRQEAARRQELAYSSAARKANRISIDNQSEDKGWEDVNSMDIEQVANICEYSESEISLENIRCINNIVRDTRISNPMRIPPEAWKVMIAAYGTDGVKKFIDKRQEIEAERKEKASKEEKQDTKSERPNLNMPPIAPRQYQREAKANMVYRDDSETDSDSEDDDRKVMKVLRNMYPDWHIGMVRTVNNATTMVNTTTYSKLIFDSGADTSVIGENWMVSSYYGPRISLIGFDSQYAKKKNLRVCTAETIIEHPQHGNHLLRIHQAVHNPDAKCTLLSEYQLSENGCRIDAKPVHHRYPDSKKGTQCVQFPGQDLRWKFNVEACLMTIPHRKPTDEERQSLTPIELTDIQFWNPGEHTWLLGEHSKPYLTYSNQDYELISECNAVMLAEDKSRSIYYDCHEEQEMFYFDTNQGTEADFEMNKETIEDQTIVTKDDPFLDSLSHLPLQKMHNPYDIAEYIRLAYNLTTEIKQVIPKTSKQQTIDPKEIQPCLAYLPLDVIKKTLQCTTQLAKWHSEYLCKDIGNQDFHS